MSRPPAFKSVHPDDLPYAQVAHDLGLSPLPVAVSPKPVEDKSQVVPFLFKDQPVRVLAGANGEPWFVARDVCAVLGHSNTTMALSSLDDDEKNTLRIAEGIRGNPNLNVISESGLYQLVFTSRKPEAKEFTRWVKRTVLPAIRKHGGYLTPQLTTAVLSDPDLIIGLATKLKEEQAQNAKLAAEKARIAEEKAKVEFAKRKIEIEKARVVAVDSHALQMQVEKSRVLGPRHDLWVVSRANVQA